MMYICFTLALVMLAASPMRAADAETIPAPKSYKTVVRVDPRSGKLVRAQVALYPPALHSAASSTPISPSLQELVERTSRAHQVDPLLVDSVIRAESNYNPNAVSPKGAEGLMQLMPTTARMLGVTNSFDPAENIEAGVKLLKHLQDIYKDDRLALAAYNAGPGAVDRFKQVPPYPETQKYVETVNRKYGEARSAALLKNDTALKSDTAKVAASQKAAQDAAAPAPAPPQEPASPLAEEKHPKLEEFIDADGKLHLRTTQ
jgi:soluble lytic murein transglycosylase-like protein